jgi:hypothetical protein
MITNTKIGNYGRLGNQLFQYAILIVLREKFGYEIKLPNLEDKKWHGQKCLLNNFNINYKIITQSDKIEHTFEEKKKYDLDVFNIKDNTNITGYYGDNRYLIGYENIIIEELTPKDSFMMEAKNIVNEIKNKNKDYKIISLHVRRGDTDLSIYEGKLEESTWGKYLHECKKIFGVNCKFLVFTGGNRNDNTSEDYNWCRENLLGEDYLFLEENSTMIDFCCMLNCDGHVLAPTSTLSWWVGFLNQNRNKKIVAPRLYKFMSKEPEKGFYPEKFILV